MQIQRTANAGVLLELDGVTILLDGVCRAGETYLGTPDSIRARLEKSLPDAVAVTHAHSDHFDPEYGAHYTKLTGRPVLTPETGASPVSVGSVSVTAIPGRHIGPAYKDMPHVSYILQGSKTVWFMGDAAPSQWRGKDLPRPDVIIAPYAYANTEASWALTQSFGASDVILVHLPSPEIDPHGLWRGVLSVMGGPSACMTHIPRVGETLIF